MNKEQERTMFYLGNPQGEKTQKNISLIMHDTRYKIQVTLRSSSKTSMLNQHLQYQVSLQEYMPLSHWPHQMKILSYPNLLPRNVTKNRNPKRFPHKLNDLHKHKSRVKTTTPQTLKIGSHQTSRPILSLTRINTIPQE